MLVASHISTWRKQNHNDNVVCMAMDIKQACRHSAIYLLMVVLQLALELRLSQESSVCCQWGRIPVFCSHHIRKEKLKVEKVNQSLVLGP